MSRKFFQLLTVSEVLLQSTLHLRQEFIPSEHFSLLDGKLIDITSDLQDTLQAPNRSDERMLIIPAVLLSEERGQHRVGISPRKLLPRVNDDDISIGAVFHLEQKAIRRPARVRFLDGFDLGFH